MSVAALAGRLDLSCYIGSVGCLAGIRCPRFAYLLVCYAKLVGLLEDLIVYLVGLHIFFKFIYKFMPVGAGHSAMLFPPIRVAAGPLTAELYFTVMCVQTATNQLTRATTRSWVVLPKPNLQVFSGS